MDTSRVVASVEGIELKPIGSEPLEALLSCFYAMVEFALDIFVRGTVLRRGELLDFAADATAEVFKTKALLVAYIVSSRYVAAAEDAAVVGCIARNGRRRPA